MRAWDRIRTVGTLCPAIVLLAIVIVSSGCVAVLVGGAAAAGAGTMAYVRGELQSTLDAPYEQAWTAAQRALADLQMPVTAQDRDGLSGRITARATGDRKILVQLRKVTGTATEVRIRVGTWGDESLSRQILEQIQRRL
jgi:type IV secretory pathway TrbL component